MFYSFTEKKYRDSKISKCKANPITCHEGPEGEQKYRFTFSLTSALDWVGGQRQALPALSPSRDLVPFVQDVTWAPGSVWAVVVNLASL